LNQFYSEDKYYVLHTNSAIVGLLLVILLLVSGVISQQVAKNNPLQLPTHQQFLRSIYQALLIFDLPVATTYIYD
jgi:hypothetical protein